MNEWRITVPFASNEAYTAQAAKLEATAIEHGARVSADVDTATAYLYTDSHETAETLAGDLINRAITSAAPRIDCWVADASSWLTKEEAETDHASDTTKDEDQNKPAPGGSWLDALLEGLP